MSLLSTIGKAALALVPGFIARRVGIKPGPDVKPLAYAHWIPPHNSVQSWDAGPARCYYCLNHELSPQFQRPCPRKRPSNVELA